MAEFPFQLPPAGGTSAGSASARGQRFLRNVNLGVKQQQTFLEGLSDMIRTGQSSGPSQSVLDARRAARQADALRRLTGAQQGVQGPSPFRWATGSRPAGYLPTSTTGSALVPTTGSALRATPRVGGTSGVLRTAGGRLLGPATSVGLVGYDIYDATQTGRDPVRAGIRGALQVGGGLLTGAAGGLVGLPTTGPGGLATAVGGYALGSGATGAAFDAMFPEMSTPKYKDNFVYGTRPGTGRFVPKQGGGVEWVPAEGLIGPVPQPSPNVQFKEEDWEGLDPRFVAVLKRQQQQTPLDGNQEAPFLPSGAPRVSEKELRRQSARSAYDEIRADKNLTDAEKEAAGLEMWRSENPKLAERLDEKTFGERVPGKAGYNPLMQSTFGYQKEPAVRQPLEGEEIINAVNANEEAKLRERFTAPEGANPPKFVVEEVLQPAAKDKESARAKLLQRALTRRVLGDQDFPANAPRILSQ